LNDIYINQNEAVSVNLHLEAVLVHTDEKLHLQQ